jgi:hypothetical protein
MSARSFPYASQILGRTRQLSNNNGMVQRAAASGRVIDADRRLLERTRCGLRTGSLTSSLVLVRARAGLRRAWCGSD